MLDSLSSATLSNVSSNCNVRDLVMDSILNSDKAHNQWLTVDCNIPSSESFDLFHKVVQKFSRVRCVAFINRCKQ